MIRLTIVCLIIACIQASQAFPAPRQEDASSQEEEIRDIAYQDAIDCLEYRASQSTEDFDYQVFEIDYYDTICEDL